MLSSTVVDVRIGISVHPLELQRVWTVVATHCSYCPGVRLGSSVPAGRTTVAGGQYYVMVHGYGKAAGFFTLEISCGVFLPFPPLRFGSAGALEMDSRF